MPIKQIQLGKNGVTDNFIRTLKTYFQKVQTVKISVLKSARGDGKEGKQLVNQYAQQIVEKLGEKFSARVIGFVITIKKWRQSRI